MEAEYHRHHFALLSLPRSSDILPFLQIYPSAFTHCSELSFNFPLTASRLSLLPNVNSLALTAAGVAGHKQAKKRKRGCKLWEFLHFNNSFYISTDITCHCDINQSQWGQNKAGGGESAHYSSIIRQME